MRLSFFLSAFRLSSRALPGRMPLREEDPKKTASIYGDKRQFSAMEGGVKRQKSGEKPAFGGEFLNDLKRNNFPYLVN